MNMTEQAMASSGDSKPSTAKASLAEAQESALVKTRAAARATDQYVRANPWLVLTIAAGAGVALGYLLGRAPTRIRNPESAGPVPCCTD